MKKIMTDKSDYKYYDLQGEEEYYLLNKNKPLSWNIDKSFVEFKEHKLKNIAFFFIKNIKEVNNNSILKSLEDYKL